MGNLCSKSSSESDPFAQPGRTIGSVPAPSPNSRDATPKIASTGHTLGSAKGGGADGTGEGRIDARSAAARAAEERATKATQQQQKGKLGRGLAKERAQTWDKTLGTVSQDERLRRDTDQATQARNWN